MPELGPRPAVMRYAQVEVSQDAGKAWDVWVYCFYLGITMVTASVSFTGRQPDMRPYATDQLERGWRMLLHPEATPTEDRANSNTHTAAKRPLMPAVVKSLSALTGLPVAYAFSAVRLATVWAAYCVFHALLAGLFPLELAILGTLFVGATVPITTLKGFELLTDFPEIIVFSLGVTCLLSGRDSLLCLLILLGTLNRETTLLLAFGYGLLHLDEILRPRRLAALVCAVACWALPHFALSARIGHLYDFSSMHAAVTDHNVTGLKRLLVNYNPFNNYLYGLYMFGLLWAIPLLNWKAIPRPFRRLLPLVPLHTMTWLTFGGLDEPRQLIPLYPLLVPASLFCFQSWRQQGQPGAVKT